MAAPKKTKPASTKRKIQPGKGRSKTAKPAVKPAVKPGGDSGFPESSGLASLAAGYGVDPDVLLAVTCQLLRGVAGGGAWIGDHEGGMSIPKFDSLVPVGAHALRRAVEHLVARIRMVNSELAAAMSGYSPEVLGGVMHGAFAGGKSAKVASAEDTKKAADRHRQLLVRSRDTQDALANDLAGGDESRNIEAVLHPSVLIEHARVRDLLGALDACHQRSAIVVAPKLYSHKDGSDPVKDLELLGELLEGLCVPSRPALNGRPVFMPFSAHAILVACDGDLEKMAASVPGLAGRMIWMSGDPPPRDTGKTPAARSAEDAGAAGVLWTRAFENTVRQLLSMRRSGRVVAVGFTGADEENAFRRMTGSFRETCGGLAREAAVEEWNATGDLATVLFWGMRALLAAMPSDLQERFQSGLLEEAHAVAGRLAKGHFLALGGFLRRDQIRRQLLLAERIVELVGEKEPLSRRNLVRCFNNQLLARFVPVLDALRDAGVIDVNGEGEFVSGEVPWMEAKEAFLARWVMPEENVPDPAGVPAEP